MYILNNSKEYVFSVVIYKIFIDAYHFHKHHSQSEVSRFEFLYLRLFIFCLVSKYNIARKGQKNQFKIRLCKTEACSLKLKRFWIIEFKKTRNEGKNTHISQTRFSILNDKAS
jgi:hypothetical protein